MIDRPDLNVLLVVPTEHERVALRRTLEGFPTVHVGTFASVPSIRADLILVYPVPLSFSPKEHEMVDLAIDEYIMHRLSGPDAKLIRM